MSETIPEADRVYIREAAEILNRRMDTLRRWERPGVLPKHLKPHREKTGRRWRYWSRQQIEGIKKWLVDTDRRPGKGLPTLPDLTPEEAEEMITKMRGPSFSRRDVDRVIDITRKHPRWPKDKIVAVALGEDE